MSLLLSGCKSNTLSAKPSVQITQVPPADPGGPVQMAFIEGGRLALSLASRSFYMLVVEIGGFNHL